MRVVIIPKADPVVSSLTMANSELTRSARASQLKELKRARTSVEAKRAAKETLSAAKDHGFATNSSKEAQLPVTGTVILESAAQSIASLKADLPQHYVIMDYPLSLVPPAKSRRKAIKTATNLDLWHLEAINLQKARARGFTGKGAGINIAVLDTGIAKVAELKGRVDRAIDLDVDAGTWKEVPSKDTQGHGTHVSGLICGVNVGVAPAAQVVNVVALPGGRGSLAGLLLALEYVAQSPDIAIMNMSAGIEGYHPEMAPPIATLRRLGVLPVAAVGNEGRNRSSSPGNYSEVLSVGASTARGTVSSFSSGGRMTINGLTYTVPDLVAPGDDVYSCVMNGGYEAWDGTSMATPIVSGLATLVLEKHPDITLAELEEMLLDSCQSLGAPAERQGAGVAQLPASLWMTTS